MEKAHDGPSKEIVKQIIDEVKGKKAPKKSEEEKKQMPKPTSP